MKSLKEIIEPMSYEQLIEFIEMYIGYVQDYCTNGDKPMKMEALYNNVYAISKEV